MRQGFLVSISCLLLLTGLLTASGCGPLSRLKTGSVETRVVTVGRPEEEADSNSMQPAVTGDGHFVVFASDATDLINEEFSGGRAVYLKNIRTGETVSVSSDEAGGMADGDSEYPAISADGRYVAFQSTATSLVPEAGGGDCISSEGLDTQCSHIYLKDLETGAVTLVSTDSDGKPARGNSIHPAISADGRYVAFRSSAENLVAGDGNGTADIFVKDTRTGFTTLVSSDSDGASADNASDLPSVSADGRVIAFKSLASNLVSVDGNGSPDVFIKDRETGITTLVSSDSEGSPGNKASGYQALAIAAGGDFVVFESEATNLSGADDNRKRDVFVKNIQTGGTTLVSSDAAGTAGDDDSFASVSISADGRYIAFGSNATNLVPGGVASKENVFIKDITTGAVTLVSADATGVPANGGSEVIAIAGGAGYAAFVSAATNLVEGDTNGKDDIFLKELSSGKVKRVSTSSSPEQTRLFIMD